MFKQRWVMVGLLIAILLISIKLVQQFRALHAPARHITFACAVAVQGNIGQVSIEGDPGAQVHVTITYCTRQSVNSPVIANQVPGTHEYRWIWQVDQPASCAGKAASAQAAATWQMGVGQGRKPSSLLACRCDSDEKVRRTILLMKLHSYSCAFVATTLSL